MILDSGVFIALDNPARLRVVVAVVDASLAVLADQLDQTILTTDPVDMARLGVRHRTL